MLPFLERLRVYLERVARAPEGLPLVHVDVAVHRKHLLQEVGARIPVRDHKKVMKEWKLEDGFPAFINLTVMQILEDLAPDATSEQLTQLVNAAINRRLGAPIPAGVQRSYTAELDRIWRWAWEHHEDDDAPDGWLVPARYALETRLVRKDGTRVKLSRSGSTLIELPSVESVRWLLGLETAQSLGPTDDWRLSPDTAKALLEQPEREVSANESWSHSQASLRRLNDLQVLNYKWHDRGKDTWGYEVPERSRPMLEEAARKRSTPFTVLADALLRDDLTSVLDRLRPAQAQVAHESAASAVALQARMVVHEIRNALVPTEVAFSSLMRNLGEAAEAEPVQRARSRVESGIQRALTFVDDMLRVANLGMEPPATFDAATAVREAGSGLSSDLNGNLRFTAPDQPRPVAGPRSRFVLAIANLLRNAAQAIAGTNGKIEVSFGANEASVVIHVDDSGPGVPAEQRRAIFEPGVALRSGGSGQGLALVRQVIEGEMNGTVTCEDSPLGGARFTIFLPAQSSRNA